MLERTSNETSDVQIPVGLEAMMQMPRPVFAAMAEINSRLYESIAAVNKEWISLVNRRLKEDLAVSQQLAACKTLTDMCRVYAQFFQSTCSHYQSGFDIMTKLTNSIAEKALQPMQSRPREGAQSKH